MRRWEELPDFMRTDEVRPYWEILWKKRGHLAVKRMFDIITAVILLLLAAIPMIIIALMIKIDSRGPVMYRQERVTTYGKHFRIHKFRTMIQNADRVGTAVTVSNDNRITRMGSLLRGLRLDELPQLIDVLEGNMSFVGTRPEAAKYVEQYRPEFNATLLVPAGITSEASIRYKDEYKLLSVSDDVDKTYVEQVLPGKMKWNLNSIERFSFFREMLTMLRTVLAVIGKDYD
ncbi:Sugar transferase involved in LPS biosynthesis (colanic, teichoic acid) [Ruminococcus flavefaciens]|uniref:Sugar transferase involved in LPS biosynthesis (Colanic, teichoic acid) n=2 Tax=Ruminococcus flavefaciens TaxID=1265 RepID=A0A1H6JW72_RUMFL|nr:sugar transferase [Ruminococcus flavefaciens]SEH65284.1 Sugar transferase involved in LPS biosynthesis (colanic, teichoic acid) [Ruminococcus flavefaciens]